MVTDEVPSKRGIPYELKVSLKEELLKHSSSIWTEGPSGRRAILFTIFLIFNITSGASPSY